jgi:hypothetical protein
MSSADFSRSAFRTRSCSDPDDRRGGSLRPMIFAALIADGQIIDRRMARGREAVLVEHWARAASVSRRDPLELKVLALTSVGRSPSATARPTVASPRRSPTVGSDELGDAAWKVFRRIARIRSQLPPEWRPVGGWPPHTRVSWRVFGAPSMRTTWSILASLSP